MSMLTDVQCPVLVGRDRELDVLERALESATEGHGGLVMVTGDAGVGKTRLLGAALDRAVDAGTRVATGGCLEHLRPLSFAPVAELLRSLLATRPREEAVALGRSAGPVLLRLLPELDPDWEDTGDREQASEEERYRVAQVVCAMVAGKGWDEPLLLVLEDLHWADTATIELISVLARRLADSPALMLATFRSDEVAARSELVDTVSELRRKRLCVEVPLQALAETQVERGMIREILGVAGPISSDFVEAVFARTGGNPLFVEELLRTLVETGGVFYADGVWDRKALADLEVPSTLQEAILRRVRELPEEAMALLRLAAVSGERFDLEPVRTLAGLSEEEAFRAVRVLVEQHLLLEDRASGGLRFRHALTRDTVYGRLLLAERRLLHRRVAETLERTFAGNLAERAGEIAFHSEAAGDDGRHSASLSWREHGHPTSAPSPTPESTSPGLSGSPPMARRGPRSFARWGPWTTRLVRFPPPSPGWTRRHRPSKRWAIVRSSTQRCSTRPQPCTATGTGRPRSRSGDRSWPSSSRPARAWSWQLPTGAWGATTC